MLETKDIVLMPADSKLAVSLLEFHIRNKDFLRPFEPQRNDSFYTLETQKALLNQEKHAFNNKSAYRFYLAQPSDPSAIIGSIGISNIIWGSFLSAYIGYKIDCDHQNKGYMTQAVQSVVRFAFDHLKLHRIEGNVMPRNIPSIRVLEKCGFEIEGLSRQYLKINGIWEDHIHMVLLNDAV